MFLLDDILLAPAKGFLWILREVQKAADEQVAGESDELTARLSTLYMQLETGQITQAQFDEQERAILDRLDEIAARGEPDATEPDDGENETAEASDVDEDDDTLDSVEDEDEDKDEDADDVDHDSDIEADATTDLTELNTTAEPLPDKDRP